MSLFLRSVGTPGPKRKKKKANKAYAGEEEKQGEVGITHGTLTGPENSSS